MCVPHTGLLNPKPWLSDLTTSASWGPTVRAGSPHGRGGEVGQASLGQESQPAGGLVGVSVENMLGLQEAGGSPPGGAVFLLSWAYSQKVPTEPQSVYAQGVRSPRGD